MIRLIGILLIILGIVMIVFREVNFTREKKVADLGPIELNKKEHKTVSWPIYAGIVVVVGGVVVLVASSRKTAR